MENALCVTQHEIHAWDCEAFSPLPRRVVIVSVSKYLSRFTELKIALDGKSLYLKSIAIGH